MLEITRVAGTRDPATYALNGEITVDQVDRIESLIQEAVEAGRTITLDLRHVWRIERNAASLIAQHASRPNGAVRIVGVPGTLFEWLNANANGSLEPGQRATGAKEEASWNS